MILDRLFERRYLYPGDSAQWERWFGNWAPEVAAGVDVDQATALTFTAVYAAIRLLSESLASLPLFVYERLQPRGKRRAVEHPLYRLLHANPNPDMSSFTLRETMMGHILTWGNSYAEIVRQTPEGYPVALRPLNPQRMAVERNERSEVEYHFQHPRKGLLKAPASQILHVAGLGYDGLKGYSPITLAREAVGLGIAAEQFGAGFFGRGARPSGVIEFPGEMTPELKKSLREEWERLHASGPGTSHRTAVLEQGLTWKQLSMPNDDAQFLQTRQFQIDEVARIFNMPVHLLRKMVDSSVRANIEQESLDFVIYSLRPWLVRWEQEIQRQLFRAIDRDYFAEFQVAGLLRGDFKSRMEGYAKGKQNGIYSTNDIRELENMNPTGEAGDVYTIQVNMQNAETLLAASEKPAELERDRTASVHLNVRALLADVLERLQRKEQKAIARARKRYDGAQADFDGWFAKFCTEHEETVESSLRPIVELCHDNSIGRFAATDFCAQYVGAFRTRYLSSLRELVANGGAGRDNGNGALLKNELARLASVIDGDVTYALP